MPDPSDVPGYWDGDGDYWVYGADSPEEAEELLSSGEYGIEVGTVNGEDYVEVLPTDILDGGDLPDPWDDREAYERALFGGGPVSQ